MVKVLIIEVLLSPLKKKKVFIFFKNGYLSPK